VTIAVVHEIFLPIVNGVITSTYSLARNLQEKGHRVFFIASVEKRSQLPYIGTVKVHYIPGIPSFVYPQLRIVNPWNYSVEGILNSEAADIVHITGQGILSWSAITAARRAHIPIVHSFHTLIYKKSYLYYGFRVPGLIHVMKKLIWKYIGTFIHRSDITTTPSAYVASLLRSHFPESHIVQIHNSIDFECVDSHDNVDTLLQHYPEFTNKSFLFVGRLGEEKSVHVLIEAFRKAYKSDRNLRLFVVGDGPKRREYERAVRSLQLEGVIKFLGRLPHTQLLKSGLYHYSRALVTASTTENQPLSVIEALACNTPIIVPEVEGITELLFEGGRTFPAGDTDALAGEILEAARDDDGDKNMSNLRGMIEARFGGAITAEQFEKVYHHLLGTTSKMTVGGV